MKGVIFMSERKRYSMEFKAEIVQRYLQGNIGLKQLASEYHIPSQSSIKKWVSLYREHGMEGLCTAHKTYSGDFKLYVVEYMHNTGASLQRTAIHFNIPSKETVKQWERIYFEEGKEALYEERRGRANGMEPKKSREVKNHADENEDLIAEVQRLRMENEYLKKLNALVQERERSEKSTK